MLTRMMYFSYHPYLVEQIGEARAPSTHDLLDRSSHTPSLLHLTPGSPSSSSLARPAHLRATSSPTSVRHRIRAAQVAATQAGLDLSSTMSRTASGHNRPTHIALPTSPFVAQSPNGSPLPTPTGGMASPASPRNSFLPSFMNMRTRNRAATLSNPRGATSPSAELSNPMGAPTTRGESSRDLLAGPASRGGGVTRTVSTPVSGGLVSGAGLGEYSIDQRSSC